MLYNQYEKAKETLERIEHLKKVLRFLRNVNAGNLFITMRESGFVAHPKEERTTKEDLPFIIEAYEKEIEKLQREFDRL